MCGEADDTDDSQFKLPDSARITPHHIVTDFPPYSCITPLPEIPQFSLAIVENKKGTFPWKLRTYIHPILLIHTPTFRHDAVRHSPVHPSRDPQAIVLCCTLDDGGRRHWQPKGAWIHGRVRYRLDFDQVCTMYVDLDNRKDQFTRREAANEGMYIYELEKEKSASSSIARIIGPQF